MDGWVWPFNCVGCGEPYPEGSLPYRCTACGGIYDFSSPLRYGPISRTDRDKGSLERFLESFPIPPGASFISMGEGYTPLIYTETNGEQVFLKCEHLNPTGSFKDRGTAVLVSALYAAGVREAVEDSSGNAGASFAAYAARAGIGAKVFVPDYASGPKCGQIEAYGAEIVRVPGPRSATSEAVQEEAASGAIYASHAYLPHGLAGMATVAYELYEQLGTAPGSVIMPVGQGSLLLGVYRGFNAMLDADVIDRVPQIVGVQAVACAPLHTRFMAGPEALEEVREGETIAEGIRILRPHRADAIMEAVISSSGRIIAVDEDAIRIGHAALGRLGVFVEPTSAVVWPALHEVLDELSKPVVAVLTGSGFKSLV
jgi:threonine synthase